MNNQKRGPYITDKRCDLCEAHADQDALLHLETLKHRFNFYVFEFKKHRKPFLNHKGIDVKINFKEKVDYDYNSRTGAIKVVLTPQQFAAVKHTLHFKFSIINNDSHAVESIKDFLVESRNFSFLQNNSIKHTIGTSESETFSIRFGNGNVQLGSFKMPILIRLYDKESLKEIKIYRHLKIVISDIHEKDESVFANHFRNEAWNDVTFYVPPTCHILFEFKYPIPQYLRKVLAFALKPFPSETESDGIARRRVVAKIREGLNKETYRDIFHYLLWLDEICFEIGLTKYNMSNVNVTLIRERYIEIKVPGLAEKRPSVLRGDLINIRLRKETKAYQGQVKQVTDETVIIEHCNPEILEIVQNFPDVEMDVQFTLTRLQYERMHLGIDLCPLKYVFPAASKGKSRQFVLSEEKFFNKTVYRNQMQRLAVLNILNNESKEAPFIIFGPPGTGKTTTVVESILQLINHMPTTKILICCPSNFACDMLCHRLQQYCKPNELLRMHTTSREVSTIDNEIMRYSNMEGEDLLAINAKNLTTYKIVISTLHLIGKFLQNGGIYEPNVVFIDEAAQATEPEAAIAISLLPTHKAQLILAGDIHQLGPVVAKVNEKSLLATPLMQRLMEENPLYESKVRGDYVFDTDYIILLEENFRSHKDIIAISNQAFYRGALKCRGKDDLLSNYFVSRHIFPQAHCPAATSIEFCGLLSKEQKNGGSPSYYNVKEIDMVARYVQALMSMNEFNVQQKDIGIITPYIRQMHKIKIRLDNAGLKEIQVGTTEAFQGQEKRIIIISTVRAQDNLFHYDRKYNLGFVQNKRRFNVALTRAMSKLIVIGNPYVLGHDENWNSFIEYCQDLNTYCGTDYIPRTDKYRSKTLDILQVKKDLII